ncbi:MAG TPA: heme-binding domain-containing protein [Bryobacteraceae bacterium]|nr:heme-binding domain-containing protein [Bryobacteraceae bacterium]
MPARRAVPFLAFAAALFLGLQLLPAPRKTNPPVNPAHTLESNVRMSPAAALVLRRACKNCHSNETRWPLYSYIAPFSWLVVPDVQRGRNSINFSEWSVQAGRRPELAASILAATCTDMRVGRMPTRAYMLLNPDSKLSAADIETYCAWTAEEVQRQLAIKRNRPAKQPVVLPRAGVLPNIYKILTNGSGFFHSIDSNGV